MVRIARTSVANVMYHITQRGNNRQDVFLSDQDRHVYFNYLEKESNRYGLKIHGFCLMTNHIHLIAMPLADDSLALTLGRAHYSYSVYFNHHYERSGHLWQNRFYSCPLEPDHYLTAMRYVERNPVRASLVASAWDHPWSSAAAHVGCHDPSRLLDLKSWKTIVPFNEWKKSLAGNDDPQQETRLCTLTRTGRPMGSDTFTSTLEARTGRRLQKLPRRKSFDPLEEI